MNVMERVDPRVTRAIVAGINRGMDPESVFFKIRDYDGVRELIAQAADRALPEPVLPFPNWTRDNYLGRFDEICHQATGKSIVDAARDPSIDGSGHDIVKAAIEDVH